MINEKKMITLDGNEACAHVAYHFTEVAGIFPITPSSPMAEKVDEWAVAGKKNMFNQPVTLVEMQSEGGAAGFLHGASEAGALATTFTASQGLLLMIPNLYIMVGHRMPAVFHVAARSVAQHANNIFGDHQDVMSCRTTGATMMSTGSVQEVMDLSAIAHLTTIKTRVPFIHFFDGFRTSHEIQTVEMIDLDKVAGLLDKDALKEYHNIAMNPEHPLYRTTVQGGDVYFQHQEANNADYNAIPGIVEGLMGEINKITGRNYHIFNYYGADDANRVIVLMGSATETVKEVVDYLNNQGEKVGVLQIHLFRPFDVKFFLNQIPKTVKYISALDRSKELGSIAGAVYLDVCAAYNGVKNAPKIYGGRYGLASKDVTPAQIKAVYDNMKSDKPKEFFTIGIVDDVTNLSLSVQEPFISEPKGNISCKFWGIGGDGTVGANKNSAKIIGDYSGLYTQAYFEYDSKKTNGITKSHLRFSKTPIRSTYYVKSADFLACHVEAYLDKYDMLHEIKDGGTFLLNTSMKPEELNNKLPANVKRELANKKVEFYIIDAVSIAEKLGLGGFTNLILQAAFFKLTEIIPIDEAVKFMKKAAKKTYARKGEEVVAKNITAIDAGIESVIKVEVPELWKDAVDDDDDVTAAELPDVYKNIVIPCNRQRGDDIPVSAFLPHKDGTYPLGTSKIDKRGIATHIPVWHPENCIQCNQCSFVCPHAVIRPFIINKEEAENATEDFIMIDAQGAKGYKFRIEISKLDCTGCGSCANICPAKQKALTMEPVDEYIHDQTNWNYALSLSDKSGIFKRDTIKGSQLYQPLMEFSGACAGCGETPYAKLLTQLYGEKMYWVNGVGCSLAWAGAFPSLAYTTNNEGRGPAYYGTLFEDQAENGLGIVKAVKHRREGVKQHVLQLCRLINKKNVKQAIYSWIETYDNLDENDKATGDLISILETTEFSQAEKLIVDKILSEKDQLAKKVTWLFGGDGWAYDIGYGGLDHVLASGENINILVVDTEVYSNTGGQSSKATPIGASAKFADGGKKTAKKDLGRIFLNYENIYVASVAMGANMNQLVKAITEAVNYDGPSLVIAYAPCISHGIKNGMGQSQNEMKKAVECGLWPLYRYNPSKKEKPFSLDYKKPSKSVKEFFDGQVRFNSLKLRYPDIAEELFVEAQENAKKRYETYVKLEKFFNEK